MNKVILLSLIISTQGFASSKLVSNLKNLSEATSISSLKKYESVITDGSQGNRVGKEFTFNGSPVGTAYRSNSWSLEIGKHITSNDILTFQTTIMRGSRSTNEIYAPDMEGTVLSVGYKKFTSNSFYIKPEIYHRRQQDVTDVDYTTENGYTSEIAELEDMGIGFRIGNQWQWENFTIGCDWIGLSSSLLTIERTGDTKNLEFAGSALNFYLGMSF